MLPGYIGFSIYWHDPPTLFIAQVVHWHDKFYKLYFSIVVPPEQNLHTTIFKLNLKVV